MNTIDRDIKWNFLSNTEKFFYTILAPKTIQPNADYTLSLTIHNGDVEEPVVLQVSIEDEDNVDGFNICRDVTMKANATEVVSIPIGDLPLGCKYKLVVRGLSGVVLEKTCSLEIQTQAYTILIQTDKAIYKPNDCIKFRIIVLNSELKAAPINKNELSISFNDPCRNLIRNWNGVNTKNGVFSDEFQLSDLPSLGEWILMATVGDQTKKATVEVAEYVLPKFEVFIDSADHFVLEDKKVTAVIRAKYTDGQLLKANVTVTIEEEITAGPVFGNKKIPLSLSPAKKTLDVSGHKTIEFDIANDLNFCHQAITPIDSNYIIKVEATEILSGTTQSTEKTVRIHNNTYVISTDLSNRSLKQDSTVKAKISVRRHDGSLPDLSKNLFIIRNQFYSFGDKSVTSKEFELDRNGDAQIKLYIDKNECSFSLEANYGNQKTGLGRFFASMGNTETPDDKTKLEAKVLTESCSVYKEIEVEVTADSPIPSYTYLIIARGKILETKTVLPTFASDCSEYVAKFSFFATSDHAPKTNVVIFNVQDKTIVSTNVTIKLNGDFRNFIELDVAPNEAKPGQMVDINIKTNPHSYIGLLGIDKSSLLLRSGNDLTVDEIWSEFEEMFRPRVENMLQFKKNQPFYKRSWENFRKADLLIFSNTLDPIYKLEPQRGDGGYLFGCSAVVFGSSNTIGFGNTRSSNQGPILANEPIPQLVIKPKIRTFFPETWIWESIEDKNFSGLINLKKKVPDSLTTWVLTGISIDPVNGLAITKAPSELCVQQKFHISLNLPYSVKRGEVVAISCSLFNYLPDEIEAEVIFENENNEFEFIDYGVDETCNSEIPRERSRKQKLSIGPDDALYSHFTIRPTKVGPISLKVLALSSVASDCLIKTLNVECEGVPQFVNKAVFVDLRDKNQNEPVDVVIEIPKIAIPDSTRIEITCVGDLFGGTIKNLEKLIRLPFGCGEQNMLNFVPNIVILDYLQNTCQLTDLIEARIKKFMTTGYLNELQYKHKDGSFSAFGESDKSGSTWLTAFVARSFRQATKHIIIQDQYIDDALIWLSKTQTSDGSFVEKGSIFHKEMQGGASNGLALTAYVLTTFLMEPNSNQTYAEVIQKATNNIVESVKSCTDVYALAMCAYALQWADQSFKQDVLNRLRTLAKTNDSYIWWDKSIASNDHVRESKTLNVEITGYALMALLLNKNESECLPIFKWLLDQRNDLGGFKGTQDTIIGINALADFAAKIATKNNDVNIDITASNDNKFNFNVNKDNALVLQSQKLSPDVKSVRVNANGNGFSLLQVGYRYNIMAVEAEAAFSLKPLFMLLTEMYMSLEITTSYQPPNDNNFAKQSNMVVLEVALPSGFVVNIEILEELKSTIPIVKRTETKCGNTVAVLYLDHLTADPIVLSIDGTRDHEIDEQKPASILIYDYYDSALCARQFYSMESDEWSMEIDG